MNLRETILNKQDKKLTPLDVDEWSITVWLRSWSAAERARFQREAKEDKGDGKMAGLLCALSLCDEQGNRLFSDEDAEALADKSCTALDSVAQAILKLNGLEPKSADEAKKD